MTTEVLSTGSQMPRQRPGAIARPRLMGRLHANVGAGLAVLQAPAGFGKTALAAGFAQEVEFSPRWLTLDPSSATAEVFAEQLGRALFHGHGWAPASASRLEDLRAYISVAMAEVAATSPEPVLLVVDNVHYLRETEDSADLLGWYVENQPRGWELILSGRDAPGLVSVDKRVSAGECLYLGAADLAFDVEELAAALGDQPAIDAGTAFASTQGWPAAVMALASGAVSFDGLAGSRQGAWDRYLLSEVWAAVPAEHQEALLRVCLPPIISLAFGESTLGARPWRALRGWLAGHDFLFEALPQDAIRINPMFRDFLLAEAERRSPEGYEAAAATASAWLEEHGDIAAAIELARAARAWDELTRLLKAHSSALLQQGAYALLWRAFEQIPDDTYANDITLTALHAHVLARNSRAAVALEIADRVLNEPDAPGTARMHAILARVRALRLTGDRESLQHVFDEVKAVVDCDDPVIAAEVAWQEAQLVLALDSDFQRSERLLHQGIELARAGGASMLDLLMRSTLGQSYVMRGAGPEGVDELVRAAHDWRALRGSSHLGWVLNNLGMGYQLVGDFDLAKQVLEEGVAEGRRCENSRNEAYAIASLGDAELALGDYEQARIHYEKAIEITANDVVDESLACLSIAGLSAAFLGLGDLEQGEYFAERASLIAEHFSNPYDVGMCRLQRAMTEEAAGHWDPAINFATSAIDEFTAIAAEGPARVACYRLARIQFRANRRDAALATLEQLRDLLPEPWMIGALSPSVREHALFAQWVASRNILGPAFRELLDSQHFSAEPADDSPSGLPSGLPVVAARSLGEEQVTVDGVRVADEAWANGRTRELFFLLLANRDGLSEEQAASQLYPGLAPSERNSAFHSNVYRLRRAIYPESIVRSEEVYQLNPGGQFSWDVEEFDAAVVRARALPAGSESREAAFRDALGLYSGPFASEFHSEWAESLRARLDRERLGAFASLAGLYASKADYPGAISCLERILEVDHLNDEAAYQLATYQARAGETSSALTFLDAYRRSLAEEMDAPLPERFQALREKIAAGIAV